MAAMSAPSVAATVAPATASSLLVAALSALKQNRSVFHSEADLQHALAWTIQAAHPHAHVRLETRPAPGVHLDLLVIDPTTGHRHAIEIKYRTAAWTGTVPAADGTREEFDLRSHGAQDLGGYDCVKDLVRLERCTHTRYATSAAFLLLTNDPAYWRTPQHTRPTNAAQFRVHEGTTLAGRRAWGPNTGGTNRGREPVLDLHGTYACTWSDYSTLPGPRGLFRSLVLQVA